MQIGDVVYLHPSSSTFGTIYPARVVYIHPKRAYYTVEFEFERFGHITHFKQSYYFKARAGEPGYQGAIDSAARSQKSRKNKNRKK